MSCPVFTEDHRDAMQEVANVAMGDAGAKLAQLLGNFVKLSIPRIQLADVKQVPRTVSTLLGYAHVTAARQSFFSRIKGEAIVLFGEAGCAELAELMGYEGPLTADSKREVLLDISNLLIGACLSGICRQFDIELTFGAPSLLAENTPVDRLLSTETVEWSHALLVEVNFSLEQGAFSSHLVIFLPEESIDAMRESLDALMAAL